MAFTEVLIYSSPFEDPYTTATATLLTPSGIVWTSDSTPSANMITQAIDVGTDTVVAEFDRGINGLRGIAINPSNDDLYARQFQGDPSTHLWKLTTSETITEYVVADEVQMIGIFGIVDTDGQLWMCSSTPTTSAIIRVNTFVPGTPGSADSTVFSIAPIDPNPLSTAPALFLSNGGSVAGRVYFRSNTSTTALNPETGTRGIAWIDTSTGVVTLIYTAPGRYQPSAVVDPVNEFIYTFNTNGSFPGTIIEIVKMDLDGTVITTVALDDEFTGASFMVLDDAGHLWLDTIVATTRKYRVFDTTTLTELGALPHAANHVMMDHYNYNAASVLTWTPAIVGPTGDFGVFEVSAPVSGVRQPRTFIIT